MNGKNIRKRFYSRELTLKALYLRDIHQKLEESQLMSLTRTEKIEKIPPFGQQLIYGCLEKLEMLDDVIQKVATNWRLDRMPTIDRNILRIGTYELLCCPDTPPKVAINEAIELSKNYSTEDSPNFINGVLDKVYTEFAPSSRTKEPDCETSRAPDTGQINAFTDQKKLSPDPDKRADMHLHSDASDGELSPRKLVEAAKKHGLDALSITDHDSIDGVEVAVSAGEKEGILVVPGVEMSAYTPGPDGEREFELHILGYFIDFHNEDLVEELKRLRKIRIERIRKIAARLNECGIEIEAERIIKENYSTVGRLHVALKLVEMGVCKDVEDAFNKFLGSDGPAYVPKDKLTVSRTIELIHKAGGCAVLAHPGLDNGTPDLIEDLTEEGIDGIEVHYPEHDSDTEALWMRVAQEKGLIVTGGSDFHGDAAAQITIGQETVSFAEISSLLERSKQYGPNKQSLEIER